MKVLLAANPRRRAWLGAIAALAVLAAGGLTSGATWAQSVPPKELRIGYQKYGTLVILKARGTLEKRLSEKGIEVKWTEFPFGPPLLEAINVGSIDVGTVGESPPIFAQAAGADLVYIGYEPPAPSAEALLVPRDSAIRQVSELKGKRVAVAKGSNANYLLVKVLENAGLKYADIEVSYLAPADARAAFESGRVAAWAIWDPFYASAEKQLGARVLADGTGAVANHQFYLSSRAFAEKHPDIIAILLDEIDKVDQWGRQNTGEVARFIAPLIGVDLPIAAVAANRLSYGIKPVTPKVLEAQQAIADKFLEIKLIPKPIRVLDALPKDARRN
jgi:sulfonate transport system substrate-binding protein